MPAAILIIAFVILLWSQWTRRQNSADAAGRIESLVEYICNGDVAIEGVRWADAIIRDSVVGSIEQLCSSSVGEWSAAVIDPSSDDNVMEVRINADSRTAMTLEIEQLSGGDLLVRGWSSE